MHFKLIPATRINGQIVGLLVFARALALLPLAIGCLASR
jgi:hypothetical protein